MPRLRVILPCAAMTLLTGGLAAGLACRWLVRDALARRAGVRLSVGQLVRSRGNDFRLLRAGLALLPLTWGGLVVSSPLLPSAFPGLWAGWLWPGWALVVALPILVCGGLTVYLGLTYARAGRLLAGEAEIEWRARAWLRPWAVHLVTIGVLALPALAVGLILPFRWPGLTLLRAAVALCAVSPAIGAVVALGPMLDALGARWIPIEAAARAGTPRWVSPVAFLSLAFVWGVVVARAVETASVSSPFVAAPSGSAPFSPRVWKIALPDGTLADAGIPCDGDVVDYVVVRSGTIAWCEGWNRDLRRTQTAFFHVPGDLAEGDVFRASRLWLNLYPGFPVLGVPGGVLALEEEPFPSHAHQPRRPGPQVRRLVRIGLRPDFGILGRATEWRLPAGTRPPDEMIPTQTGIDLRWTGEGGERWVVLDESLEPAGVSPLDRLVERFGAPWLCALLVAAALTLASLLLAARAGRLARALRARRADRLFCGTLEHIDPSNAVLRTEAPGPPASEARWGGAELLHLDPSRAARPDGRRDREGPCVVLGRRRAVRYGAYRSGIPEVRPSAVFRGPLPVAIAAADEIRERVLARCLALGWLVSIVPLLTIVVRS